MMQTRSRTSRRNKATVQWLPVELIIEIFRRVQRLIGRKDFMQSGEASIRLDQEYCNNLLAFALSNKEWTAIAQAELFRYVVLKNRSKTGQFLEAVRGSEKLRGLSSDVTSLCLFGRDHNYETDGLGDDLDEIALYCPRLVEVSTCLVVIKMEYFRNMKKLEKLNIAYGSILPPSTSGAPTQRSTLPITLLSLLHVPIPSPIDPSSLPLVRSLHLSFQTCPPIRTLLPQLASLYVRGSHSSAELDHFIRQSTSISSLRIREGDIPRLDDASRTVIKERIVEFKVIVWPHNESGDVALAAILDGSKAMKKVILDGVHLQREDQARPRFLETFKIVKEACKKKNIELWKEKFEDGNGKVDLEK